MPSATATSEIRSHPLAYISSTPVSSRAMPSRFSDVCPHCKKPSHRPSNCWVKHLEKAPKTHLAHLTAVDEYNQHQSVTNWCTLPDGTCMNADDIAYNNLCDTIQSHSCLVPVEGGC
ncbi:hypothetical protein VP01_3738g1 [Puccinia sorghi]|uniref:Uncharacterized protein n=1 Tax=Puccinia sorghi TaxID=27349 RepID=A0A0L6UUR9_9BASI|nr:hypothetical protein VP01_3738g1 [Puccinia sorghi]